jgi:hypothetical protein
VNVDNRWVVPYSPYLAHINVEVCSSIKGPIARPCI